MIPAPSRTFDLNTYYPVRSKLPAVRRTYQMLTTRDHSTTRVDLDVVLALELPNCASLLKLRPGKNDDHELVQQVANDLWLG